MELDHGNVDSDLAIIADGMKRSCVQCGLCLKECAFLQKHGMPGELGNLLLAGDGRLDELPFECSLCRLCAEVCPVGLDPSGMFLAMRRQRVLEGRELRHHRVLLDYERRGTSRHFTFYGLPKDCREVLFPGCALSGMYPKRVLQLISTMSRSLPHLGIVLDCCMRPSHDLGREEPFLDMFHEMARYLTDLGVERVWTACTSCHDVFRRYGDGLQPTMVYESLAEVQPPVPARKGGMVAVHDPCVTRDDTDLHDVVRRLIRRTGLEILEMPHQREKTVCCGEGGGVRFLEPELARHWSKVRKGEANGARIVTYCAGCVAQLGPDMPTQHVLDYLFDPDRADFGKIKPARSPWTYANRLWLKHRLRGMQKYRHTRERRLKIDPVLIPK